MKVQKMTDVRLVNEISRVEGMIAAIEAGDTFLPGRANGPRLPASVSGQNRNYHHSLIQERSRRDASEVPR